ncbi:MAG: hypothetical protein ABIA04_03255 [Pseudomonadota bacterium]
MDWYRFFRVKIEDKEEEGEEEKESRSKELRRSRQAHTSAIDPSEMSKKHIRSTGLGLGLALRLGYKHESFLILDSSDHANLPLNS